MSPGPQYSGDYVKCATCGTRRPLQALEWVPPRPGQVGFYVCKDTKWCVNQSKR